MYQAARRRLSRRLCLGRGQEVPDHRSFLDRWWRVRQLGYVLAIGGGIEAYLCADGARDPRGFSVKFKTQEGNWDAVFNNVRFNYHYTGLQ